MIVGNPLLFAIESEITQAHESPGFRALGYFVVHIQGLRYGVKLPDATMLANSFDTVARRIDRRGKHLGWFSVEPDAGKIADAVGKAIYTECSPEELFCGASVQQFTASLNEGDLLWAPDGDAAFDDSSFILHFDLADHVRLIAFKKMADGLHDPASLREVILPSEDFYAILQRWHDSFHEQWLSHPKAD